MFIDSRLPVLSSASRGNLPALRDFRLSDSPGGTCRGNERLHVLGTDLLTPLVHLLRIVQSLRLLVKKAEIDVCAVELWRKLHRFLEKLYCIRVASLFQFFRGLVVVLNRFLREILFQLSYINDVRICGVHSSAWSFRASQGLEKNGYSRHAASVSKHVDHLP